MSVATGNKGEKAKKFQSLNINNLYQGSALKPLQKSIPTKHGLQSLGKVPTARRAPANLPSLKAEHSGNDPSINLVPSGQGTAGGWSANKEEDPRVNSKSTDPVTLVKKNSAQPVKSPAQAAAASPASSSVPSAVPVNSQAAVNSPNVNLKLSAKATWGQKSSQGGNVVSQRSPLFGQEFPSLTGNPEIPAQPPSADDGNRSSPNGGHKSESKYGPGPSLRPQNFPTWSFGGGGKQGSGAPSNLGNSTHDKDVADTKHGGPAGLGGPPTAYESRNSRNMSAEPSGGLKFDVGVNSPLLQQGGAPFLGGGRNKPSSQRGQYVNKNASTSSSSSRPRENLFQGSIIDSEKLKRMDDIDSNDDDWTRKDDSFDYNKRIDSDEEDDFSMDDRGGSHSNWADQISFSSNNRHSEPRDNFDPKPPPSSYRGQRASSGGMKAPQHDHNHLSFLDDEDHRLSKKNEEVLKNIERARRRRAEEEQKYHRVNDNDHFDRRGTPSNLMNDLHAPPSSNRRNDSHRDMMQENGVNKSPSFGKFDVAAASAAATAAGINNHNESDGYDSEKFESYAELSSSSSNNVARSKPGQATSSVPPRFKRHGIELHSYKRSSPPKGDRGHHYSGDTGDGILDIRSSTSRESAEAQPPQEKDFGALFRSTGGNSNHGWGAVPPPRRQSVSSDQAEDLSRCEGGSLSSASIDHQHLGPSLQDEDKKIDEDKSLSRSAGGRHSLKGKGRNNDKTDDQSSAGRHGKGSKDTSKGQHKPASAGGKGDRSSQRDDRGPRGQRQSNNKGGAQEKQRPSGDQKSSAAGKSNRKREDLEQEPNDASETAAPAELNMESGGWFAPRGQPSRRGRGGLSSTSLSRSAAAANRSNAGDHLGDNEEVGKHRRHHPGQHRQEADWDESSSDRSAGQTDDARNKDGKRRSAGDSGKSHPRRDQRQDKSKKGPRGPRANEVDNDKKEDEAVEHNAGRNSNRRGGGNSSKSYREDNKDRRGGDNNGRGGGGGGDNSRRNNDRDKQSSYERRQNKLPPRLAKQKEQSRYSSAAGQQSAADAWGPSTAVDSKSMADNLSWDMVSKQQFNAPASSGLSTGLVDNETNRALLMQRFRNEEAMASNGNSFDGSNLRLDSSLAAAVQAPGLNMDEAFTAESRENAVQTIIFENTNFKGNRPNLNSSNAASDGDKLMFKLANADKALGFGKSEDDLKLDFAFETTDVDEKGEPTGKSSGAGGNSHRTTTVASSSASGGVPPPTSTPASADDLNMKIASVKKVWETLPSMSPVPATGNDQTTSAGIVPFASNASATAEDTPQGSASNIVKVRPQPQSAQQSHAAQAPVQVSSSAQQSQAHHMPPPSQGGQQVQHSQSIQMQSSSQQQQMHHAAAHQGLLQQASLDDRLLGRGNGTNLAYNRLLGTGGLPNLQSPPSILGQQPSLYQAFQIDPNRAVTYPYPPTGMGGQSLMMPPSGSAGNATTTGDIFGSTSNSQFTRQFTAPPPGSTQGSSVLMSQPSLMSSAMKPSVASAAIGPIGTKGAFQQGGLGSLAGSNSPLLIPYDGGYVQNIQRSAAAAAGQTAFYQALAASSQQAAAAATSRHQQNNYGITGFPGQQSLVQQQLMRNQVPPQMANHPYVKSNDMKSFPGVSAASQVPPQQQQQHQQSSVKSTATSLASMSLRNSVLGTGASTNGTASAATSTAASLQQGASYSPTPIQRPPGGKGKAAMSSEVVDDVGGVAATLDVASSKEKKLSDVEDQ